MLHLFNQTVQILESFIASHFIFVDPYRPNYQKDYDNISETVCPKSFQYTQQNGKLR